MLENFRLRVFREVAMQRSFRRAAEVLYISQPAVTQQIKALEEELGHRLLDRTGGRVRPTAAGAVLLEHAARSEDTLQRAVECMAALQGELRGGLRIAASTTVGQYILPRLLASFSDRHPGVALELAMANTERVALQIAAGQAQVGLVEGPVHRGDLSVEPWIEDELVLVVAAGHEWAGQTIRAEQLSGEALLMREQGSGTRAVLEAALRTADVPVERLRVAMQLASTEALLACVEAGLGVGFASRFALRRQRRLRTLAIVRIEGFRALRTLSLIRQQGPAPAGIAASFQAFLAEYAAARNARKAAGTRPQASAL